MIGGTISRVKKTEVNSGYGDSGSYSKTCAVLNDKVYLFPAHIEGYGTQIGCDYVYYDGETWSERCSTPFHTISNPVVHDDKIFIMMITNVNQNGEIILFTFDGETWDDARITSIPSTLKFRKAYDCLRLVSYNGVLHIFGPDEDNTNYPNSKFGVHHILEDTRIIHVNDAPFTDYRAQIVYNNKIHFLGVYNPNLSYIESVDTIPHSRTNYYEFINGEFVDVTDSLFEVTSDSEMDPNKKYYERYDGADYRFTSDTEFVSGKTYYEHLDFESGVTYYTHTSSKNYVDHYSYDGINWTKEEGSSYSYSDNCNTVIYRDRIYSFQGKVYAYWEEGYLDFITVKDKDMTGSMVIAFVYNDEVNVLTVSGTHYVLEDLNDLKRVIRAWCVVESNEIEEHLTYTWGGLPNDDLVYLDYCVMNRELPQPSGGSITDVHVSYWGHYKDADVSEGFIEGVTYYENTEEYSLDSPRFIETSDQEPIEGKDYYLKSYSGPMGISIKLSKNYAYVFSEIYEVPHETVDMIVYEGRDVVTINPETREYLAISEKHYSNPTFKYLRKTIKKAWIGDSNKVPRLVLEVFPNYDYTDRNISQIPYTFFNGGQAIKYNNKIHVMGGSGYSKKHYSYNFETGKWKEEAELPYQFIYGSILYAHTTNKIHILGGQGNDNWRKHYSYDGNNWTKETDLPYDCYCQRVGMSRNFAINYCHRKPNGGYTYGVHIFGDGHGGSNANKHYRLNDGIWTKMNDIPFNISANSGGVASESDYAYIWETDGRLYINDAYDDSYRMESVDINPLYGTIVSEFNGKTYLVSGQTNYIYDYTDRRNLERPEQVMESSPMVCNDSLYFMINYNDTAGQQLKSSFYEKGSEWSYGSSPVNTFINGGVLESSTEGEVIVFSPSNTHNHIMTRFCMNVEDKLSKNRIQVNTAKGQYDPAFSNEIITGMVSCGENGVYVFQSEAIRKLVGTGSLKTDFMDDYINNGPLYNSRQFYKEPVYFNDSIYFIGKQTATSSSSFLFCYSLVNKVINKVCSVDCNNLGDSGNRASIPKLIVSNDKLHAFIRGEGVTKHYILNEGTFELVDELSSYITKAVVHDGYIYAFCIDPSNNAKFSLYKYISKDYWTLSEEWPFYVVNAISFGEEILAFGTNYECYMTNTKGYFK